MGGRGAARNSAPGTPPRRQRSHIAVRGTEQAQSDAVAHCSAVGVPRRAAIASISEARMQSPAWTDHPRADCDLGELGEAALRQPTLHVIGQPEYELQRIGSPSSSCRARNIAWCANDS